VWDEKKKKESISMTTSTIFIPPLLDAAKQQAMDAWTIGISQAAGAAFDALEHHAVSAWQSYSQSYSQIEQQLRRERVEYPVVCTLFVTAMQHWGFYKAMVRLLDVYQGYALPKQGDKHVAREIEQHISHLVSEFSLVLQQAEQQRQAEALYHMEKVLYRDHPHILDAYQLMQEGWEKNQKFALEWARQASAGQADARQSLEIAQRGSQQMLGFTASLHAQTVDLLSTTAQYQHQVLPEAVTEATEKAFRQRSLNKLLWVSLFIIGAVALFVGAYFASLLLP
jgi:hypothetical protein